MSHRRTQSRSWRVLRTPCVVSKLSAMSWRARTRTSTAGRLVWLRRTTSCRGRFRSWTAATERWRRRGRRCSSSWMKPKRDSTRSHGSVDSKDIPALHREACGTTRYRQIEKQKRFRTYRWNGLVNQCHWGMTLLPQNIGAKSAFGEYLDM